MVPARPLMPCSPDRLSAPAAAVAHRPTPYLLTTERCAAKKVQPSPIVDWHHILDWAKIYIIQITTPHRGGDTHRDAGRTALELDATTPPREN
jgi:hypothetical protein